MTPSKLAGRLVEAAAARLGIPTTEITGKARQTHLVEARWAIWVVMRRHGLTFREISDQFNVCNGTVQHGVKKARFHHGDREESFQNLLESIRKALLAEKA